MKPPDDASEKPPFTVANEGEAADHDSRTIDRVLEDYLAALEGGTDPDREELLARHPQFAEELSARLDALEFIHHIAPQLADTQGDIAEAGQSTVPAQRLGDYRIIRELGRGGMGVVYEAEQLSLGRRVALKVLPFASLLDDRQLRRFKNEARAAATLDHPHIVSVYAVGSERGVHYYAMQFIDGQSLSKTIGALRDGQEFAADVARPSHGEGRLETLVEPETAPRPPSGKSSQRSRDNREFFRTAARLGIQVAEALDHAHSAGILHRDIKPGNLLMDGAANVFVTDFGIARIVGEGGITVSGDLLGTVRYMSPEQALARRAVVDHRSDIYSLGVTLYELLTLQPAFQGSDRQDLLRRIAVEDPRQPRAINRLIPAELETIVLKAISKSPGDRYATAQDLADDLRRFLDDQPIHAKRPTLLQRTAKLCRRHRAVVTAVMVTLVAALTVSTALIAGALRREKDQRKLTQGALERAEKSELLIAGALRREKD